MKVFLILLAFAVAANAAGNPLKPELTNTFNQFDNKVDDYWGFDVSTTSSLNTYMSGYLSNGFKLDEDAACNLGPGADHLGCKAGLFCKLANVQDCDTAIEDTTPLTNEVIQGKCVGVCTKTPSEGDECWVGSMYGYYDSGCYPSYSTSCNRVTVNKYDAGTCTSTYSLENGEKAYDETLCRVDTLWKKDLRADMRHESTCVAPTGIACTVSDVAVTGYSCGGIVKPLGTSSSDEFIYYHAYGDLFVCASTNCEFRAPDCIEEVTATLKYNTDGICDKADQKAQMKNARTAAACLYDGMLAGEMENPCSSAVAVSVSMTLLFSAVVALLF